jgi:hypothetical protein
MPSDLREQRQRRVTYLTLTGLFLTLFGVMARREQKTGQKLELRLVDMLLLGLAVFRGGRLIAWDHVTEPIRAPFTEVVPDPSGAGETVEAAGTGPRYALGQLLSCPICSGTWVAAVLVYGLRLLPGPTRLIMTILGVTGAAELLNSAAEAFSWQAAAARQETGRPYREERARAAREPNVRLATEEPREQRPVRR